MRVAVRIVVCVLAVFAAAPLASATVGKSSPGLSKVKWRLVVRSGLGGAIGAAGVVANDRYVAFVYGPPTVFADRSTLIDEQTGRRRQLSGPDCASPVPMTFGGPWLMVTCPGVAGLAATYQLYNLSDGSWAPFQISSQCRGFCGPVAVGRYWVKIVSDEGSPAGYPFYDYYLQNIATGQFERDPATPGGTVFDDLSAPSGSVPLCRPLQYPSVFPREGPFLGQLTFYGQFAVTFGQELEGSPAYPGAGTSSLRRCGSKLNLVIGADGYTPVASSRAVVTTRDDITFHGLFLPSLRRFTIRLPVSLQGDASLLAVTDRTIYVGKFDGPAQLWAATLPSAHHRSRWARPSFCSRRVRGRASTGPANNEQQRPDNDHQPADPAYDQGDRQANKHKPRADNDNDDPLARAFENTASQGSGHHTPSSSHPGRPTISMAINRHFSVALDTPVRSSTLAAFGACRRR